MRRTVKCMTLVLVFVLVFAGSAFAKGVTAQDNPFASGKWYLGLGSGLGIGGGSDTYEPEDQEEVKTNLLDVNFGAQLGYFVLPGWEVGLALRYDYGRVSDEDDNIVSTNDYLLGIQTGYYYAMPVPIHPFINVEAGYAGQATNNEPDEGDETSDTAGGFAVRPSLGALFFFTDDLALAPSFYYQYTGLSGTDDTTGEEFDYDVSSSRFGFQLSLLGIF